MSTTLITGGTGLLGSHLSKLAQDEGHSTVAMIRKIHRNSFLASSEANCETRDVGNQDLFKGIDSVIHTAGLASPYEKDHEKMLESNLTLTQNLFKKAKSSGVKHWIQISSIATLGPDSDGDLVHEESKGPIRSTFYAKTKFDTEKWLEKEEDDSIRVTVIHPCYMLGRWDSHPSSGSIFFALAMGKLRHFVNTEKNFVAAQDVARAIWTSLDRKKEGHFVIGGENIKMASFFNKTCRLLNLERNELKEIDWEGLKQLENPEEKQMIREYCSGFPVSCEKAKRELDYLPKLSISEALTETMNYFSERKILRPAR